MIELYLYSTVSRYSRVPHAARDRDRRKPSIDESVRGCAEGRRNAQGRGTDRASGRVGEGLSLGLSLGLGLGLGLGRRVHVGG